MRKEEFHPWRPMTGFWLQLHACRLREAIPYGALSAARLRKLAWIAERFDRGYGHVTTRQNIQRNCAIRSSPRSLRETGPHIRPCPARMIELCF